MYAHNLDRKHQGRDRFDNFQPQLVIALGDPFDGGWRECRIGTPAARGLSLAKDFGCVSGAAQLRLRDDHRWGADNQISVKRWSRTLWPSLTTLADRDAGQGCTTSKLTAGVASAGRAGLSRSPRPRAGR